MADFDTALRGWRRVSAALTLLQLSAGAAIMVLVLVAGPGARPVALALTVAVLIAELGQWALARAARRRTTACAWQARLEERPLAPSERALAATNLALSAVGPLLLLALIAPSAVAWGLITVAFLPGLLSLVRVLRRNTWLAVGRIPGRPPSLDR